MQQQVGNCLPLSALQGTGNIGFFAIPVLQQVMVHVHFDDFVVAADPCELLQALMLLSCLATV